MSVNLFDESPRMVVCPTCGGDGEVPDNDEHSYDTNDSDFDALDAVGVDEESDDDWADDAAPYDVDDQDDVDVDEPSDEEMGN